MYRMTQSERRNAREIIERSISAYLSANALMAENAKLIAFEHADFARQMGLISYDEWHEYCRQIGLL